MGLPEMAGVTGKVVSIRGREFQISEITPFDLARAQRRKDAAAQKILLDRREFGECIRIWLQDGNSEEVINAKAQGREGAKESEDGASGDGRGNREGCIDSGTRVSDQRNDAL